MSAIQTKKTTLFLSTLSALALFVSGCGDGGTDDGGDEGDALEILGSYTDDFGGNHEITADTWTMDAGGVFHIVSFDNEAGFVVAQNDAENEFNPELWSRMDWTWDADALYFCQVAFDAETQADAETASGADPSDLAMGCGGFGWSLLTAQ